MSSWTAAPTSPPICALSTLGDGALLRHVAALADLTPAEAAGAAGALADMHLLCPGEPLSFLHPLLRHAVEQSIPPLARGQEHARATAILDQAGQPAQFIAPHLPVVPAEANARAVAILRVAARSALASGAVGTAVGLLRRALEEGSSEGRADLLAELAQSEVKAGLAQAAKRLGEAIDASRIRISE